MRRCHTGFGLLEMVVALAIGLMLLAAASQLFVSAHQTWRLQSTAVRMQDSARLALLRMAQDIRMAGMFGCLRLGPDDFLIPGAEQAFARPLANGPSSLSLVVAELPGYAGDPDWTLLTNCIDTVEVHKERAQGTDNLMALPFSRHRYVHVGSTLYFERRGRNQPLVDYVRELRVVQVAGERIDLQLTLYEPTLQLEQHHALSVALRNPVPDS
ncbi:PilW family protein [Pseudomonas sp. CGJS7]|uniref:PilW family protein n=1 Tax=Pseudomonas sp. CGJS7 TaxID=3109348 RepID=UPI00300B596F